MKRRLENILVTGGAGFIGSNFIHFIFNQTKFNGRIINLDKLTYAGNLENLKEIDSKLKGERYFFEKADICNFERMKSIFIEYDIDTVVNFAAESHVDRSIFGPKDFIQTNIMGTFNLLEVAREVWKKENYSQLLFHHISTDEVYGSAEEGKYFLESTAYTISQNEEGMSLIQIEASVISGSGKLNISGTGKVEVRDNVKNVYRYIKANEKSILSQEHSLSNYDVSIQLSNLIGSTMSNGIGAAVFVTILSAIHKRYLKPGIALLGDISINGAITRVDNFSDKVAMLSENGAKLVLTPMDNLKEIENTPPSILNNTDINFYSNTQMILQKAISNE